MARTRAHRPYKFVPSVIVYKEALANAPTPRAVIPARDVDAESHFRRERIVRDYARQENRRARKNARAALARGRFDDVVRQGTGRHTAMWWID